VRGNPDAHAVARSWATSRKGQLTAAVTAKRYKLLAGARTFTTLALFDLEHDSGETRDISAANKALVDEMTAWLRASDVDAFPTQDVTIDEGTRERLRALGYTE
jgi:hypothetical protein